MSAYYGNLLPANLPNGGTQDPYIQHEGKYEASFYGNSQTMGFDSDAQHPGFPRFPPYDRLDIRPITSAAKAGYPTSQAYQTAAGIAGFNLQPPQNGQYTTDEMGNCKNLDRPLVNNSHVNSSSPPGMVTPFGTNNLGQVVNGVQPQNIPIYPWMRPMNGGKLLLRQYAHFLSALSVFIWVRNVASLCGSIVSLPET